MPLFLVITVSGMNLRTVFPFVFAIFLKLFCWSWIAGFGLGLIATRTAPISRGLLLLVLVMGFSFGAPAYLTFYWQFLYRTLPILAAVGDPISALWFYRSLFPFFIQIALVVIPSLVGIHSGQLARAFRKPWRVVFRAFACIAIAQLLWQNSLLGVFWGPRLAQKLESLQQFNRFAMVGYWPLLYLLAMRTTRRIPAIAFTK